MSLKQLPQMLTHRCLSHEALSSTMRAWQIYNYGNIKDLRLTESYRTPAITDPNEVLIKVDAASVNPIDLSIINGYGASVFNLARSCRNVNEFPKTLGRDFCGTVVKAGRAVRKFREGAAVIGALWPFEEGSHADYLICHQCRLAVKPHRLSATDAAALPYAGLTAFAALTDCGRLQIHNNDTSNRNQKYDIIFDCIGDDFDSYAPYLKSRCPSRYITIKHSLLKMSDQYSPFIGFPLAGIDMTTKFIKNFISSQGGIYHWAFFRSSGRNLSVISDLVDRGLIVPVVHAQFAFEDAPEAYKCLQSGGIRGKVIIQMNRKEKSPQLEIPS